MNEEILRFVAIVGGLLFIGYTILSIYKNYKKTKDWIKTEGKINKISWTKERQNDGHVADFGQETVSFTAYSKSNIRTEYTATSKVKTPEPKKLHSRVTVYYNLENKKDILIHNNYEMYIKHFFVLTIGITLLYAGLYIPMRYG